MTTTTTEELRGVVEYVYRVREQLEVKIEGCELAVFLSKIKGGDDFQAGDTIAIVETGGDWAVEILERANTGSVLPIFQDESDDEGGGS